MRIATIPLVLAVLLIAVPVSAVDRLVDEQLAPCLPGPLPIHRTISAAVTAAVAGETIVVCPGTYKESVVIERNALTIRAAGLVNLVAPDANAGLHGFVVRALSVTLHGFDISGFTDTDACGVLVEDRSLSRDTAVLDNHVHGNDAGICTPFGLRGRVENNLVEKNAGDGVALDGAEGMEVSRNTVRDNGGIGIAGAGSCTQDIPNEIHHNLVIRNEAGGISSICRTRIHGNTLRDNEAFGIRVGITSRAFRNLVQSSGIGILVEGERCEVSFNSVTFNDVGIDVVSPKGGCLITRNNVSRSTVVDCRWDQQSANTFIDNNCGTEEPPGAFD